MRYFYSNPPVSVKQCVWFRINWIPKTFTPSTLPLTSVKIAAEISKSVMKGALQGPFALPPALYLLDVVIGDLENILSVLCLFSNLNKK